MRLARVSYGIVLIACAALFALRPAPVHAQFAGDSATSVRLVRFLTIDSTVTVTAPWSELKANCPGVIGPTKAFAVAQARNGLFQPLETEFELHYNAFTDTYEWELFCSHVEPSGKPARSKKRYRIRNRWIRIDQHGKVLRLWRENRWAYNVRF